MAELSVAHRALVAQLAERCSDATLAQLTRMTLGMPGAKAQAIAGVLGQMELNRRRRALALGPLLPLFQDRPDGIEALSVPAGVLPRVWAAASAKEASLLPLLDDGGDQAVLVAERLCRAAAAAVRDMPETVWPPALAPEARDHGLSELASCLDLAMLARKGAELLPALILRPTGDQVAEFRLLIKDSDALAPEGARRMLDILFAHLGEAFLILRVITQTSGAAGRESFLSESELAGFVERLLAAVQLRVERLPAASAVEAHEPTRLVEDLVWTAHALQELDLSLKLQAESEWGRQVREARVRVSETLQTYMRTAEKAAMTALPLTRQPIAGRMTRSGPKLDADPASAALRTARALLALVRAGRSTAVAFGCESHRKSMNGRLADHLASWAEEALNMINAGEAVDGDSAIRLVEAAADLLVLVEAEDLSRSLRRRAAVAGSLGLGPSPAAA